QDLISVNSIQCLVLILNISIFSYFYLSLTFRDAFNNPFLYILSLFYAGTHCLFSNI
ncbi:hypothetical protein RS030_191, partial [Cryptosporidium xiaoi]